MGALLALLKTVGGQLLTTYAAPAAAAAVNYAKLAGAYLMGKQAQKAADTQSATGAYDEAATAIIQAGNNEPADNAALSDRLRKSGF